MWFNFDKIAIACQSKVVNKQRERLQLHFFNKSKDFIPRGFSYLEITVFFIIAFLWKCYGAKRPEVGSFECDEQYLSAISKLDYQDGNF